MLQYIDDRLIGQCVTRSGVTGAAKAKLAVNSTCELLHRLGYTVALGKSSLAPANKVNFLGMTIDSESQMFLIPEDKREKFEVLRDHILQAGMVSITTLQRLMGNVCSLVFVFQLPAYT